MITDGVIRVPSGESFDSLPMEFSRFFSFFSFFFFLFLPVLSTFFFFFQRGYCL